MSVGPSVGRRSVHSVFFFLVTNVAIFEGKKSSNDIEKNDTMSDDEVAASDVSPRLFLFLSFVFLDEFSYLYKRVCPSVGRSVGRSVTRV